MLLDDRERRFKQGLLDLSFRKADRLSQEDLGRLVKIIEEGKLIVEVFGYGFICGIAMRLYEHPSYPHVPPTPVLVVHDHELPDPVGEVPPRGQGCVHRHHWQFFHGLASRPDNLRWLKQYGLQPPREAEHYNY